MVYHTNSLQVLFDRQRPVSISGWGAIESDGRLQFICSPLEKLGPLEHCQNTKNTKPKRPTKKSQSEKKFWKNQPITKKSLPTTKKEIRWIFLPWSTKPWTSVPSFTKLKTLHLIPVLIILEIIPNVPIEHPQLNHGKMHQVKFNFNLVVIFFKQSYPRNFWLVERVIDRFLADSKAKIIIYTSECIGIKRYSFECVKPDIELIVTNLRSINK